MIELLKKLNTAVATIATIYAVSKFMYNTFKNYEKKYGKCRIEKG